MIADGGAFRRDHGFTLVEMLLALVIVGIMGLGIVSFFRAQSQAHARQSTITLTTENVREGLDLMARELQNAGFDPLGTGGGGFATWTADSIRMRADLNADGDTADTNEDVLFYYRADVDMVLRESGGTTGVVAENVPNFQFTYHSDAAGTTATTAAEITQVRFAATYQTPDARTTGNLSRQIAIRNAFY